MLAIICFFYDLPSVQSLHCSVIYHRPLHMTCTAHIVCTALPSIVRLGMAGVAPLEVQETLLDLHENDLCSLQRDAIVEGIPIWACPVGPVKISIR